MLRLGLIIAVAVVLLDQLTKAVMLDLLPDIGTGITITSFFNLVHVRNSGVSFGLLQSDSTIGPWLLSGFALVVSAVLAVWLARADTRLLACALGLTIGGAVDDVATVRHTISVAIRLTLVGHTIPRAVLAGAVGDITTVGDAIVIAI